MLLVPVVFAATPASLLAAARGVEPNRCDNEMVRQIKEQWTSFTPAEQAELDARLSPPGFSLGGSTPPVVARAETPRPPDTFPTSSCWEPQMPNVMRGNRFELQWEDGVISQSTADELLESLELSWEVEVDELGWEATVKSDDYLLPVFVTASYSGGAYTTVESCEGWYAPYIVFGYDSFYDMDWARTAAAHEFNHAIQFSTSYAPEAFWWEATATYIEELVYPDVNYWSWYVTGYTDNPELAFNADGNNYDEFNHMYGMAIFGFYLDNHQGGDDVVRQTWDAANNEGGYYGYTIAEMVEDIGLDWDEVYVDFITRNAAMEYDDHRYFPDVDEVKSVDSLPASGESKSNSEPEGYGQNYIRFEGGAGEGRLQVDVELDDGISWAIVLAEVNNQEVKRSEVVTVEKGTSTASITMDDIGAKDVVLILSPTDESSKSWSYSWSASIVDAPEVEDTAALVEEKEEASSAACGCASTPPVGAAAALLGFAAFLRRRR